MSNGDLKQEIDRLSTAVATLTDGKWEWKSDGTAIVTVLSALGGLVTGGLALAMQLGLIG